MTSTTSKPLIGISGCSSESEGGALFYKVGDKYVLSIAEAADAVPVMIPPIGGRHDFEALLDRLDGVFLTGSPSNVEPQHYRGSDFREGVERDPHRDSTTLPLTRLALERGVPLFAVCRGHQELNVVMGGSLHQHVEELPGKNDHRMDRSLEFNARYDKRHPVTIEPGGMLERLNGGAGEVMVNSLHAQAIDRLGDGLRVEAVSDDGLIEAVSIPDAPGFVLSVQWHPEHRIALQWPLSRAMFAAFGDAARARMAARSGAARRTRAERAA